VCVHASNRFSSLFSEAFSILYGNEASKSEDAKKVKTTERLTTTFLPREKYVVHGMTLKRYLLLGMKLHNVHRVLAFKQTFFLKKYVDYCTSKRVSSTTEFGKTLWKFVVNGCFGKFIERVRDRVDCKFVHTKAQARRLISHPLFKAMQIVNRNLVIVFMIPEQTILNKPISVGFTILDRAKEFMFDKYYNFIKPNLQSEVLYGDTDSLFLMCKSKKRENLLNKIGFLMDYSNYPVDHPQFDTKSKNKLGFFKDELQGQKITKFVSLRAKSYSFLGEKTQTTKLKGITKAYRKEIPFNAFLKCVQDYSSMRIHQFHIRSREHVITTDKVHKLALSSFDINRYVMPCGIHTVPYGSYLIRKVKRNKFCPMCIA
jgi:hypothetical protein